jgi:hypothetical protein
MHILLCFILDVVPFEQQAKKKHISAVGHEGTDFIHSPSQITRNKRQRKQ